MLIGFPASDPASAGRRCHRYAVGRQQLLYNEGPDQENTRVVLQSFRDFVEFCERTEREAGEPCTIVASY